MDICAQDKRHIKVRGCVELLSFLLLEPGGAFCKLYHGFNDYLLEEIDNLLQNGALSCTLLWNTSPESLRHEWIHQCSPHQMRRSVLHLAVAGLD